MPRKRPNAILYPETWAGHPWLSNNPVDGKQITLRPTEAYHADCEWRAKRIEYGNTGLGIWPWPTTPAYGLRVPAVFE